RSGPTSTPPNGVEAARDRLSERRLGDRRDVGVCRSMEGNLLPVIARSWVRRHGAVWVLYVLAVVVGLVHLGMPSTGPHTSFSIQGSPWSDALVHEQIAIDFVDGFGLRETSIPT